MSFQAQKDGYFGHSYRGDSYYAGRPMAERLYYNAGKAKRADEQSPSSWSSPDIPASPLVGYALVGFVVISVVFAIVNLFLDEIIVGVLGLMVSGILFLAANSLAVSTFGLSTLRRVLIVGSATAIGILSTCVVEYVLVISNLPPRALTNYLIDLPTEHADLAVWSGSGLLAMFVALCALRSSRAWLIAAGLTAVIVGGTALFESASISGPSSVNANTSMPNTSVANSQPKPTESKAINTNVTVSQPKPAESNLVLQFSNATKAYFGDDAKSHRRH